MSNTFSTGGGERFSKEASPFLRPHIYGPECTHSDKQMHPGWERLRYHVAYIQVNSNKICRLFYIHRAILLKYIHQKGHNTVDWARWRNSTTSQRGPAPWSCIGTGAC